MNDLRSFIKRHGTPLIIQDDDANYFTPVELIENVYGRILRKMGFKVSFAVIPFVKDIEEPYIPRKHSYSGSYFPVAMNRNLCEYLARSGNVSIALHGYSHNEILGTSEFVNIEGKQAFMRISRGKILLESAFNRRLNCFVPPHHYLNRHVVMILSKLGLIPFTNPHKLLRGDLFSVVNMFPNLRLASLIKHIFNYALMGDVREHRVCDLIKPFSVRQLAYFDHLLNDIPTSRADVEDVDVEFVAKSIYARLVGKLLRTKPFIIVIANHHWSFSNRLIPNTFAIELLERTLEQMYSSIPVYPIKMDEIAELLMSWLR